jgi:hypothetical protein
MFVAQDLKSKVIDIRDIDATIKPEKSGIIDSPSGIGGGFCAFKMSQSDRIISE